MFDENRVRRGALLRASLLFASFLSPSALWAQTMLPPVDIRSAPGLLDAPQGLARIEGDALFTRRLGTNDSAALLSGIPGASLHEAGGVASLPALRGLGADRVAISVNGMTIGASCPNEMNSPLSYIDPARVERVDILAGITPVSMGGDSIAGTIVVKAAAPRFADGGGTLVEGRLSSYYRSVSKSIGGALSATVAGENLSLSYHGAGVRARNYKAGGSQGRVASTEFESYNHALSLAARRDGQLLVVELGRQYIPYEAFVNQPMDMVDNRSWFANARYEGDFDWGRLEGRVYWQDVRHEMNFLADKLPGSMPMNTRSTTFGFSTSATLPVGDRDTVRLGADAHHFTIDDWWPPVAGSMMMGPDRFVNLNNGRRDRLGGFVEWERQWSARWTTLAGVRVDSVWMDTGKVQPYSPMPGMMNPDAAAAIAFNARDRARNDVNVDAMLTARFEASDRARYEIGVALKSRAPNLYERYSWGRGSMSSRMVGWFGDGNGYVGDPDLKSETALLVNAAASWTGPGDSWKLRLAPHYSRVDNYVGVRRIGVLNAATGQVQLQFANHDAELYGIDVSGEMRLWKSEGAGEGRIVVAGDWLRGRDTDTGDNLYRIQPLNARIALEHRLGGWSGAVEIQLVDDKSRVDPVRNEPRTEGFALVHLRTAYETGRFRIDAGIDNLFDKAHALPLGGEVKPDGFTRPVPGKGRSVNLGLTVKL